VIRIKGTLSKKFKGVKVGPSTRTLESARRKARKSAGDTSEDSRGAVPKQRGGDLGIKQHLVKKERYEC